MSQPKGVSFSYCDDDANPSCVNTDLTAAQDALDFFKAFFDGFPELKKNDFYLTAESYGGTAAAPNLPSPPNIHVVAATRLLQASTSRRL